MEHSPFRKRKRDELFQRELTTSEKFSITLREIAKESFISNLPSDDIRQMAPRYMYPAGSLLFALIAATYIALFITGYNDAMNTTYLAPYNPNSKYCDDIPASNTGTFYATKGGLWGGDAGFQFSAAAYVFSLSNYIKTLDGYQSDLYAINESLAVYGELSKQQDLGQNLLYWMSLHFQDNSVNRFELSGSALVVFDRFSQTGSFSSLHGVCNATSIAEYNIGSGQLSVSYSYSEFINNPVCNVTTIPKFMGYTPGVSADTFSVSVDVRSLITGLAINTGLLLLDGLEEVSTCRSTLVVGGVLYNTSCFYDARYPGMAPLTCIYEGDFASCIISLDEIYAFPVFNHIGSNSSYPSRCDCSELTLDELSDLYAPCNVFTFLSGLLFYPVPQSTEPLLEMYEKYSGDLQRLNSDAYNATFIASAYGVESELRDLYDTPEYRASAFEFCNTSYGTCSMVTFTSFDPYPDNWAVSEFYYQIETGACQDTITSSQWDLLVEHPFANLTEKYQTCRSSPSSAVVNQLGVTAGNIILLMPFIVLVTLGLVFIFERVFGVTIPKSYSRIEKDQALDALAISLLLARDSKTSKEYRSPCSETGDSSMQGKCESRVDAVGSASTAGSDGHNTRVAGTDSSSAAVKNGIGVASVDSSTAALRGSVTSGDILELLMRALEREADIAYMAQYRAAERDQRAGESDGVDWGQVYKRAKTRVGRLVCRRTAASGRGSRPAAGIIGQRSRKGESSERSEIDDVEMASRTAAAAAAATAVPISPAERQRRALMSASHTTESSSSRSKRLHILNQPVSAGMRVKAMTVQEAIQLIDRLITAIERYEGNANNTKPTSGVVANPLHGHSTEHTEHTECVVGEAKQGAEVADDVNSSSHAHFRSTARENLWLELAKAQVLAGKIVDSVSDNDDDGCGDDDGASDPAGARVCVSTALATSSYPITTQPHACGRASANSERLGADLSFGWRVFYGKLLRLMVLHAGLCMGANIDVRNVSSVVTTAVSAPGLTGVTGASAGGRERGRERGCTEDEAAGGGEGRAAVPQRVGSEVGGQVLGRYGNHVVAYVVNGETLTIADVQTRLHSPLATLPPSPSNFSEH